MQYYVEYPRYSVLKRVFVAPKHRRRRIGSYLVEMTLRQSRLPIYCWSTYNCVRFFQRLGFVSIPLGQLSLREIIDPILSVLFFTKPLTYR
jgi:predicted N-acetyltransferase YhbS